LKALFDWLRVFDRKGEKGKTRKVHKIEKRETPNNGQAMPDDL
jgi:hypothetical protein